MFELLLLVILLEILAEEEVHSPSLVSTAAAVHVESRPVLATASKELQALVGGRRAKRCPVGELLGAAVGVA